MPVPPLPLQRGGVALLERGGSSPAAGRFALGGAAAMTVCAAVGLDVAAAERPLHVLSLAVVASVVAAIRISLAGRHSGLLFVVNAAVVAQPAFHAVAKQMPAHLGPGDLGAVHGVPSDMLITAMHAALAALIACAVVSFERPLLLAAMLLHVIWQLLAPSPLPDSAGPDVRTLPARSMPPSPPCVGYLARRGPPQRMRSAIS
jgi:hypothetical protein